MADLSGLTAEVTNMVTVVDSAIALIEGLAAKLAEAANDPIAVQALADELHAKAESLAQAITANTPV